MLNWFRSWFDQGMEATRLEAEAAARRRLAAKAQDPDAHWSRGSLEIEQRMQEREVARRGKLKVVK